jgi:hypothetical protein
MVNPSLPPGEYPLVPIYKLRPVQGLEGVLGLLPQQRFRLG